MKIRIQLFTFLLLAVFGMQAQITSVGLIGPGSPVGDWDTDANMVQDADNPDLWTLTATLNDGAIKFRADDAWDINWGNNNGDFPMGVGVQGEGDLYSFAGDYTITFNSATGEYYFDVDSDIGLIGAATPYGDWDTDWDMYKDQTDPNKFFTEVDLTAAECKFRKDNAWDVNWGANTFPSGTAVLGDGGNIAVEKSTRYLVTFDTLSGAYNFEALEGFDSLSLIGAGAGGDWDTDIYLQGDADDFNVWTGLVNMAGGEYKFRANGAWDTSWGGPGEFPADTATVGSGDNLVAEAGLYFVTFNSETGIYDFEAIVDYSSVAIIGTGSPSGNWDDETPMIKDANDPYMWTLKADLLDGDLKFRADNSWDTSWGGSDFPAGIAELNGLSDIPVTGGEYKISFNTVTREYNFELVVEFESMGLIGMSGPNADWDTDVMMTVDADNPQLWYINSAALTTKDPDVGDQGVKFRAEGAWDFNWGANEWPMGVGTPGGDNIPTVEGTYGVTFNSLTGEYLFGDPLSSAEDIIDPAAITVFPNPTSDYINVNMEILELSGDLNVSIIDMSGKVVMTQVINSTPTLTVNVRSLAAGNYLLKINNNTHLLAKKFSVIK